MNVFLENTISNIDLFNFGVKSLVMGLQSHISKYSNDNDLSDFLKRIPSYFKI